MAETASLACYREGERNPRKPGPGSLVLGSISPDYSEMTCTSPMQGGSEGACPNAGTESCGAMSSHLDGLVDMGKGKRGAFEPREEEEVRLS